MNMDIIVGSYFNGLRRCRRDGSRDNFISIIRCKLLVTIASVNIGEVYVLNTPRDTYVVSYMIFGILDLYVIFSFCYAQACIYGK